MSDQLNLAHVTRTKTKRNKRQCQLSSVQVQDPLIQSKMCMKNDFAHFRS